MSERTRRGTSIIDVLVSLAIILLLFGGIYLVYFSLLDAAANIEIRAAATEALTQELEIVRNLPYESVGVVGGAPAGVIPPERVVAIGGVQFKIKTVVRNIDDPFDGTLGGTPNDTAPADYKFVELEAHCVGCPRFVPLRLTATVAPKNLEAASTDGSLFVNVFNAAGTGIPGATVRVVNASVTPTINLTDTTNASGVLQLVGVPTSSLAYQIDVSKSGYSSEKNYPPGDPQNPNPIHPYATVAAQTVTTASFSIDALSELSVLSSDHQCAAVGDQDFTITGAKLIGTAPDVVKFTTSTATDAAGQKVFSGVEWDTYSFVLNEASQDPVGTIPLSPMIVNPSSSANFRFVVRPANPSSLLVTVRSAPSSTGISGASANLARAGFSETRITGRSELFHTDWTGGQYATSSGLDMSASGTVRLLQNASSTYSTSTPGILESSTFDTGGTSAEYYSLSWNPSAQPPQTGTDSLKFQIAANNDNATWNYTGPDGTGATHYAASSTLSGLSNNRYVRYRATFGTQDENFTPRLDDVSIAFSGECVPQAQVLFSSLSLDTYTVTVTAPGYAEATSSVAVGGAWQQIQFDLVPP